MREIASAGQLRLSLLRWMIVLVPLVLLLGMASARLSSSAASDAWYAALRKPAFAPPGGWIGAIWTVLYILIGAALALVAAARRAIGRRAAIALFAVQLAINLAWAPIFFAAHLAALAFWWIVLLFAAAVAATALFFRVRRAAGLLMLPYLAWLLMAGAIAFEIDRMNPGAQALVPAGADTQISF